MSGGKQSGGVYKAEFLPRVIQKTYLDAFDYLLAQKCGTITVCGEGIDITKQTDAHLYRPQILIKLYCKVTIVVSNEHYNSTADVLQHEPH